MLARRLTTFSYRNRTLARINSTALILGTTLLVALAPGAKADTIAWLTGNLGGQQAPTNGTLTAWDVTTNTLLPCIVGAACSGGTANLTGSKQIDSLIFTDASMKTLAYSIITQTTGALGEFSLNTGLASTVANTQAGAADLTLTPSGNSILVSNAFADSISTVNLTTPIPFTVTNTATPGGARPDGITFDNTGKLFVVLNENEVAQLDPTTFAIIKTIATPNGADGLTFDATTGNLYVGADGAGSSGAGFYTVNDSLTSAVFTQLFTAASGAQIDGVASLGTNLFLVNRNVGGIMYNLTANTFINSPNIIGADDIAPLTTSSTPEPASMVLFGTGFLGLGLALRRKARRT